MSGAHNPEYSSCDCDQCETTYWLVEYIFGFMEPTDRALRPAGNICPVATGSPRP